MGEAAAGADVSLTVLATSPEDPARLTVDQVLLGVPARAGDLQALLDATDVVTFDHELVDLALLRALRDQGAIFRPSPDSLAFSVDKAHQRQTFAQWGLPVPRHFVATSLEDLDELVAWSDLLPTPPVLKAATGGYDGRGVIFPTRESLRASAQSMLESDVVVAEERVTLRAEVAQLVVRGLDGDVRVWPLVVTVQVDGMCSEVVMPALVDPDLSQEAEALGRDIAQRIDLVGVMAVELFVTDEGLVINELALRPHNSGHWTIEGARTSQFENHLRAVAGRPLGPTEALTPAAVMVNVVGGDSPGSLDAARAVDGVTVHDYAKSWRPGRKLGHVTACDDDVAAAHVRAWESARAYGTSTQEV